MLRAIWTRWRALARRLGAINSWVILALLYFLFMAPFALAIRLFSDPLRLRPAPAWQRLSDDRRDRPTLDAARQQF